MILQMADPVKELKEIRFTSEKEMQHFCEKNMEQMLGLQFITSEFRVAQFRFDSVAYNPVSTAFNIIEYKNDKNFSVVDQGYSYISTLLQHKADFVLRYNQIFNINKRLEDFDWTQVRVLFIAPSYTVHQLNSINFNDLPMQLWRIKRYERGIIQFEQIKPTSTVASISGYSSMPANSVATKVTSAIGSAKAMEDAAKEIIVYTEEERLADGSDITREYYTELRDYILAFDDDIELKATKLYIGFFLRNRCIFSIKLQKNSILLWINALYGSLDDPKRLITDVTHKGHHGNGDCQIKIDDRANIGYVKDLINAFYKMKADENV